MTQLDYKHEEWKFSPKSFPGRLAPLKSETLSDFRSRLFGVGPSPDQIQSLSLDDLEQEEHLSLEQKKAAPLLKDIKVRAQMNTVLSDHYKEKEAFVIKVTQSIPSVLWVPLSHLGSPLHFEFEEEGEHNLVLADIDESLREDCISNLISFDLKENVHLNLGIHLSSAQKSFSQVNAYLNQGASINTYSLMLGEAPYKRLEINHFLNEEQNKSTLNGGALCSQNSVFDYHSNIFHLNKNQSTKQIYKSLVQSKAQSIFGGRIHLYETSAGAEVEQLNNNLLLDTKSRVDTQPELNIYHDDVKATHGATTDTVDHNKLFYLLSRGLNPEKSRSLLLDSFAFESLEDIASSDLKSFFKNSLNKALHHE